MVAEPAGSKLRGQAGQRGAAIVFDDLVEVRVVAQKRGIFSFGYHGEVAIPMARPERSQQRGDEDDIADGAEADRQDAGS